MTAKNQFPAISLHKASGLARIRLNGRDIYLGPYGSPESYEKYAELLRQHELNADTPAVPLHERPLFVQDATVSEVILRFLKYSEGYFTDENGIPNQDAQHFRFALRILRTRFGRLPISKLTGPHLKQVQKDMVDKGWSRRYCNTELQKIRRFLRWAVSEDLCPVDVLEKARSVEGLRRGKTSAPDRPPVQPVADEIVDATLPHLSQVVRDLVQVIRLTGARPKEIRLLRVRDIVAIDGELYETDLANHKNAWRGQVREITFGPAASAILKPYLTQEPDAYVFSPKHAVELANAEKRKKRKTKVQPSQQNRRKPSPKRRPGSHYTADSLRRSITYACQKAFEMPRELKNIPRDTPAAEKKRLQALAREWRAEHIWTPYQLRHTALTNIRENFGIEHAQAVGGHARISTTEIYAEKSREKRRNVMREIG